MAKVELHRMGQSSLWATVDDADFDLLSQYRWQAKVAGRCVYARAYTYKDGEKTAFFMHTLLTGWSFVDHVDSDGLNNSRENLRVSNKQLNMANCRSYLGSSSQYKGVSWNKRAEKWLAQIKIDHKSHHLGYFTSEADAAHRYNEAAVTAWGAHARTNQIASSA